MVQRDKIGIYIKKGLPIAAELKEGENTGRTRYTVREGSKREP